MEDFIGTGWAFPPGVGAKGSVRTRSGHALVEQSMRLILTTYPGERPMRPHFGSHLRDFVFAGTDPDTLNEISREVSASLATWEPRATVSEVRVHQDPDTPTLVNIVITYATRESNDPRNMVFPFYTMPDDTGTAEQQGAQ
ncbi:GPW/gp25 family protein [Streptomyces sp. NPDC048636]|uniref:GPW/gp25 family protein n=1 Tax=Streptomyces sp. NPDC048636 TaxID=3155762 RepID=UPI00342F074E